MQGFIYVWGGEGTYKIGRAKDPRNRVKGFILMPFRCDFALEHPTENPPRAERHLHKFFKDKRTNGEWFTLSEEDISGIPAIITELDAPKPEPEPKLQNPSDDPLTLDLFTLKNQLEAHTHRAWNWAEIARRVDIHPHTMRSMVANERGRVTLETLGKLLAFFREEGLTVSISDLVKETPTTEQ